LFPALVGLLAVALCAHLAVNFTISRVARADQPRLVEDLRRRGLATGSAVLALSGLALIGAAWKAPDLWHRLTGPALPAVGIGLLAAATSLYALARRSYRLARGATLLTAVAILWGWLIAQSPHLLGARLTIHSAAATGPALTAIAIAGAVVLVAVVPAFYLLYVLFAHPSLEGSQ
jgi:cytochrome d ubiquinol oxidase subunit II